MWSELNLEEMAAESQFPPQPMSLQEIEEAVVFVRLRQYNRDLPCGPKVLREHLDKYLHVRPLPSERSIARMLARNGLTHRCTGWYIGDGRESNETASRTATREAERR